MSNPANEVIWHATPADGTAGVEAIPQLGEANQATSVAQTDDEESAPMPHIDTAFK